MVYCGGMPRYGKIDGAKNPNAINAAPMTPRPTLSQIRASGVQLNPYPAALK